MRNCHRLSVVVLLCALLPLTAIRAEENKATHDELRAMRDGFLLALNKGDVDSLLGYLGTNVVVTWQNAEVSRGREGVRAYYNKMMTGPDHLVQSFNTSVNVDELTILYGDSTGVAFGSANDHYVLKGGMNLLLHDRWTATVVKEDGHWRIASAQMSANVFDNPLLNAASRTTIVAGVVALLAGLVIGFFIGKRRKA